MAFEEHAGTDVHPVDEIPPPGRMLAFGAQHVAAMYAGVVAPPLIVGEALGMPGQQRTLLIGASLLTAGMATLLQSWGIWRIGARLPFVNGVTFGSVAPILAIVAQPADGNPLSVVYGAVLVAGVLGFLLAPRFSRLVRFFPPVVTGAVITLIGLSLLPVAVGWIAGRDPAAPDHAAPGRVALGAATFALVLLGNRFLRGSGTGSRCCSGCWRARCWRGRSGSWTPRRSRRRRCSARRCRSRWGRRASAGARRCRCAW
ncbi:hypothetical protein GCM10020366_06240 [Saccharopolyspora gregorii]|uniref:Purine permease n=1 Tax=Saccharopolyspora gregorii TaxID=33914 RepID=A0ABP6RHE6_9PSEU